MREGKREKEGGVKLGKVGWREEKREKEGRGYMVEEDK